METVAAVAVGMMCIVIGFFNRKGNVSMIHSYHRNRVSEEDRLPFGKLVGTGMFVMGGAMILAGVLTFIARELQQNAYEIAAYVVLIVGLLSGLGICFYAMIKYNKGIF